MGLLDRFADWAEPLRSKSYYTNKRKNERAGQVQGLIGQVGGSEGQGPMQPQGLLGGQMTQPQFNARLMGIPGYENNATNLMNQESSNRQSGANNRNTVQGANERFMYGQNNMSANEQAQLGLGQQRFQETQDQNDQANLYKEMGFARQDEEQYRNTTEMAGNILGSLADEDGVIDYANSNGVQQNQLVVTLAKSILGNEAVNVDDRGAITLAGGAPGWLGSLVAKMNGGNIGEADFYNVVEQLQANIQTGMERNQAMRNRTLGRMENLGGNESNMPIQIKPVQRYRLAGQGSTMADGIMGKSTVPKRNSSGLPDKASINWFGDNK